VWYDIVAGAIESAASTVVSLGIDLLTAPVTDTVDLTTGVIAGDPKATLQVLANSANKVASALSSMKRLLGIGGPRSNQDLPNIRGEIDNDFRGAMPHPVIPKCCARITPGSLPAAEEAAVMLTLGHIDAGTKPTGALAKKWGTPFKNWGGDLPGMQGAKSPYLEYRVAPSAGSAGAGTNRIVVNSQTVDMYYSWTHYGDTGDPAFVQIR
jgi:hypothetical protein